MSEAPSPPDSLIDPKQTSLSVVHLQSSEASRSAEAETEAQSKKTHSRERTCPGYRIVTLDHLASDRAGLCWGPTGAADASIASSGEGGGPSLGLMLNLRQLAGLTVVRLYDRWDDLEYSDGSGVAIIRGCRTRLRPST